MNTCAWCGVKFSGKSYNAVISGAIYPICSRKCCIEMCDNEDKLRRKKLLW